MAAINFELQEVLNDLLDSPLAWLAQEAIDQILSDTDGAEGVGADSSQAREARLRRQIQTASGVILGTLKNELAMTERLEVIAPELGVDFVHVTAPPDDNDQIDERVDDLFSKKRSAALLEVIGAWQSEMRRLLGEPDDT